MILSATLPFVGAQGKLAQGDKHFFIISNGSLLIITTWITL